VPCLVKHATRLIETDKKGKERDKGWTCDLIPKPINLARYDAEEQTIIAQLNSKLESVTVKVAELEDAHGGEGASLPNTTR
jgi:type I restriction enzyme M protein